MDTRILKFEHFINDVLKEHLKRLYEERNKVCDQAGEYLQLKVAIERLRESCKDNKEKNKKIRTQVDLGCNFFCQAEVDDSTKVFVLLGMGIFVELSHNQALEFIEEKQAFLQAKIDKLSDDCAEVKARIQVGLQALADMQGLAGELQPERRDLWS